MKLNLGNQIRANRIRMDLTQEQLAEKFCVSAQAISRWENGTTYPDIEMLPMIASFFGISVDTMLSCTEEEKKKFCENLQSELENAVRAKSVERTTELMREIRRNLRAYQSYWFWGMYQVIYQVKLYQNESILDEMRLLTEEIVQLCSKEDGYDVIWWMAHMEDDANIDAFLDTYASREDMMRSSLLFDRYRRRGEKDKLEPVRMSKLWLALSDIISNPFVWQKYQCEDAAHWKWYTTTQLGYLNAVNRLTADPKHIVSGFDGVDLWCTERISLGMRYTAALADLGEMNEAYDVFNDVLELLERIMSIQNEEEFELRCSSPALNGFTLKAKFEWCTKGDGRKYRTLCLSNGGWTNWIDLFELRSSLKSIFSESMKSDSRFASLLARLDKCIISRDAVQE